MNFTASRAAEIEASFLAGAEHNLNQVKEQRFRGSKWLWASKSQEDRLRDLLAARRHYDRELLRSLPKNAARIMTCIEPSWFVWERPVAVAIAACLSPLEFHLDQSLAARGDATASAADGPSVGADTGGQAASGTKASGTKAGGTKASGTEAGTAEPPPMGLSDLTAYVKQLVGDPSIPHLVGVCSPSGFTDEAKKAGLDMPNVTLVLVEPRPGGGWSTTCASPNARPSDARLFDPEAISRKIERVKEEVRQRRADLLTGGLSASALAERLGLSSSLVGRVFESMLTTDRELRVSWQGDDVLLFLGAPAAVEDSGMSMIEWVRQLFSGEGEETRKINALTERRAKLASRRDRLYEDVGRLEEREAELMRQGRETASGSVKRRVATQVKQVRDDMERLHAAARMVGQQIDVISTHIHSLTMIQQGQAAKLPSAEEITADAVRAEEMLEQLGADVELASSLGGAVKETGLSAEEMEILRELEGPAPIREESRPSAQPAPARTERPAKAEEPDRREPQAG